MAIVLAGPYTVSQLDAAWLTANFLQGIPLLNPDGSAVPAAVIDMHTVAAIQTLETMLDITIQTRAGIVERHDYRMDQWKQWSYLRLRRKPITSVTSWKVKYGDDTVFEFPAAWIRIDANWGILRLFPGMGSFASPPVLDQAYTLAPILMSARNAPHLFEVIYSAGLDGSITADLAQVIGMMSASHLLTQLRDTLLGPGMTGLSIGLDGLSQSISTQAGAYSARIDWYGKTLGDGVMAGGLLLGLKNKYKMPVIM